MTPATNPTWGGRRAPGPGKRIGPPRVYEGETTRRFSLTLSEAEIAWLDALALAASVSRVEMVRRLVREAQAREEAGQRRATEWSLLAGVREAQTREEAELTEHVCEQMEQET